MAEGSEAGQRLRETAEEASDSDGAPEAVSLSRGREEALKTRRAASMEARRAAERTKERRKKRQQLYKSQKVAKEERRRIPRFPETELRRLLELEQQTQQDSTEGSESKPSKKTRRKNRQKTRKQPQTERQFGSVRVVALEESDGSLPVAVGRERAMQFLQQQLYHNTRYQRIPAITLHSQKYRNKPAAIFV